MVEYERHDFNFNFWGWKVKKNCFIPPGHDTILQSIDENSSLDVTMVHRGGPDSRQENRDGSFNHSANTSLGSHSTDGNTSTHANKSVTFDENNQVIFARQNFYSFQNSHMLLQFGYYLYHFE